MLTYKEMQKAGKRFQKSINAPVGWCDWNWSFYHHNKRRMVRDGVTINNGNLYWYNDIATDELKISWVQTCADFLKVRHQERHKNDHIPKNICQQIRDFESGNLKIDNNERGVVCDEIEHYLQAHGVSVDLPASKPAPAIPDQKPLFIDFDCAGFDGEYQYTVSVYDTYLIWQVELDEQWAGSREMRYQTYETFLKNGAPMGSESLANSAREFIVKRKLAIQ